LLILQGQEARLLLRKSQSHGIVWNSRAALLFQTWKFWKLASSHSGFNLFARWHMFIQGHFLFTCSASQHHRQTDRWPYHANSWSYCVQYNRL